MRNLFLIFLLIFIVFSCTTSDSKKVDVSSIDVTVSIDRFDIDFYNTTKSTLQETKAAYPLFFPENTPDSVWIGKIYDKDEQELFVETQKIYKDITPLKTQLISLFKHVKFYNPQFNEPKVTTLLTNVDYENRVIYTQDMLLISLDVYLGSNHVFYSDFPKYIKHNYHKNHIIVDVANAIIEKQVQESNQRTFLSKMIARGKRLYLLDLYLPEIEDVEKIGYESEKFNWAVLNESQIWSYFIENKLLYSTDTELNKRFLDTAPFSKFYRAEDNLSPGRIGEWLGWQIVRSYMKHNNVSLQSLIAMDTEEIFKNSKYKPKK